MKVFVFITMLLWIFSSNLFSQEIDSLGITQETEKVEEKEYNPFFPFTNSIKWINKLDIGINTSLPILLFEPSPETSHITGNMIGYGLGVFVDFEFLKKKAGYQGSMGRNKLFNIGAIFHIDYIHAQKTALIQNETDSTEQEYQEVYNTLVFTLVPKYYVPLKSIRFLANSKYSRLITVWAGPAFSVNLNYHNIVRKKTSGFVRANPHKTDYSIGLALGIGYKLMLELNGFFSFQFGYPLNPEYNNPDDAYRQGKTGAFMIFRLGLGFPI